MIDRRACYHFFLILFGVFLIPSGALFAQESECSVQNPDACDVSLNVYCLANRTGLFTLGITDNFDLGFEVDFETDAPAKELKFFVVDGQVENGQVNESKVTNLTCRGTHCEGAITLEKADALETEFNFEQNVINFVLREKGRDVCIGKFTNNPDKISDNGELDRAVCEFVPVTGYENYSGSGYFDPAGFGTGSFFHLTLQDFPSTQRYVGCSVIGEGRYRKVLEFQSYEEGVSDQEIYGTLGETAQQEFEQNLFEYSYDLIRELLGASADLPQSRFGFSPSLSTINKGVSPSRGTSAIKSSNTKSSKKKARQRKRNKKKNSTRLRSLRSFMIADTRAAQPTTENEDVLAWLNFDPTGGVIYIAPNCYGDSVPEKAYGQLVCGADAESDARKCIALSAQAEQSGDARTCLETRDSFGILTLRAKGLDAGAYRICLDGSATDHTVTLSGDETAELNLTDSSILAERVSGYELISQSPGAVSSVGLSLSDNCTAPDFLGEL